MNKILKGSLVVGSFVLPSCALSPSKVEGQRAVENNAKPNDSTEVITTAGERKSTSYADWHDNYAEIFTTEQMELLENNPAAFTELLRQKLNRLADSFQDESCKRAALAEGNRFISEKLDLPPEARAVMLQIDIEMAGVLQQLAIGEITSAEYEQATQELIDRRVGAWAEILESLDLSSADAVASVLGVGTAHKTDERNLELCLQDLDVEKDGQGVPINRPMIQNNEEALALLREEITRLAAQLDHPSCENGLDPEITKQIHDVLMLPEEIRIQLLALTISSLEDLLQYKEGKMPDAILESRHQQYLQYGEQLKQSLDGNEMKSSDKESTRLLLKEQRRIAADIDDCLAYVQELAQQSRLVL